MCCSVCNPTGTASCSGGGGGGGLDPRLLDAVRAACGFLGRGVGGAQGIALGAACLALVNEHEQRAASRAASSPTAGRVSPSLDPARACGDWTILEEMANDPDCSPYWWETY